MITQTKKKDPWNSPYEVEFSDKMIIFSSYGKDKDSTKKVYQLKSFYYEGVIYSCTIGFSTNNILAENVPDEYGCSESVTTTPEPEDSSTNEEIKKPEGFGTVANPYIIKTIGELQWMNNDLSGYYELGNDIDASVTSTWNNGEGFKPIGYYKNFVETPFVGHFDGKGYKIKNLFINLPNEECVGMFGYVEYAVIKNVGITNSTVTGGEYVGLLVGFISYTSLDHSYATGNVVGTRIVGGLIGYQELSYTANNYAMGSATGNSYIGGLVGYMDRYDLNNSYASVTVSGTNYTGGLVGYAHNSLSIVNSSYYDKNTTGQNDTGKGVGATTAQMKNQSTYVGWDFTNIWAINPAINNGYPYLKNNPPN